MIIVATLVVATMFFARFFVISQRGYVAMVSVENIVVEFGGFRLLDSISFVVNKRDRIALTGKNGAGKSTLLKIIASRQVPTEGVVSMPRSFVVGYLPQVMKTSDTCTVFEEAAKAFERIFALQRQLESLQAELSIREDYESESYQDLIDTIEHHNQVLSLSGLYNYQAEVEKTLLGLGFERGDFDRATSEFSGGWRMRIELAKVLLQRPDVLLLDEPTNHLDIESIQWLENFLQQSSSSVLLVSHDRAFLDNVCTRTLEISLGKLYDYKVPYTRFLELRKERREQQLRTYENQQKVIHDTEAFIERFRYKATKAVQVQSRIKFLERLERVEVDEEDNAAMNLRFPPAPHSGTYPVVVEDLKKAYGEHVVFQHVNLTIRRGEKVAFVGKNGEGKTTLVKCLLGEIPYEGNLQLGHLVKIAYFAQNQPQLLDEEKTVFETIDDVAVGEIRTKLRDLLGAFMFGGEASDKKVKVLSGGERSRLAMIRLLLEPANLLIMDEPTNHLDLRSKEVLKRAVKEFTGTVIVVSHDRDFLDGLVDKVYEFGHGKVVEHIGGIRDYLAEKAAQTDAAAGRKAPTSAKSSTPAAAASTKNTPATAACETFGNAPTPATEASPMPRRDTMSYQERKEYQRQLKKMRQEVERFEAEVAAAEAVLKELEARLSTEEGGRDAELPQAYARQQKALDTAMSYWEQAATELEAFEASHTM